MKHIKTKRSKTKPQTVADRIRSNAEEQAQIDLSRIAISYNSPQPEKMHANAFLQNHHIYIKDQNPATKIKIRQHLLMSLVISYSAPTTPSPFLKDSWENLSIRTML